MDSDERDHPVQAIHYYKGASGYERKLEIL